MANDEVFVMWESDICLNRGVGCGCSDCYTEDICAEIARLIPIAHEVQREMWSENGTV